VNGEAICCGTEGHCVVEFCAVAKLMTYTLEIKSNF